MEKAVSDLFNDKIRQEAVSMWNGKPEHLKELGRVENFVYEFNDSRRRFILRITHSSHRSRELLRAETDWIKYLSDNGITVCTPVLSAGGSYIETIFSNGSAFLVCAFEKAPGRLVSFNSRESWDKEIIGALGRLAGRMHRVTREYQPYALYKRPQWLEDDLLLKADKYLPPGDIKVRLELERLLRFLKVLPVNNATYGLIHADIHSGNFSVDGSSIHLFDFDDSCYHWYIYDIAVVIYSAVLKVRKHERESFVKYFSRHFTEAYSRENSFDRGLLNLLPEIFRFREILLYIFFHKKWPGETMGKEQQGIFLPLQERISRNIPLVSL